MSKYLKDLISKATRLSGGLGVLVVFLVIFFGVGFWLGQTNREGINSDPFDIGTAYLRARKASQSDLINPLVFGCDDFFKNASFMKYESLKNDIERYINDEKKAGNIIEASVWFRDLNTECSFGINEDLGFYPASLMKLPVLMAYLKTAESNPGILKEKITYTEEMEKKDPLPSLHNPISSLEIGKSYSVENMLEKMIVHSDNRSYLALVEKADQDLIRSVFSKTGADIEKQDRDYLVTTRSYSRFYRALYNATFLNPEMSKKALALLALSVFQNGIEKGVHPQVVVAHKFGLNTSDGKAQLHDCGIVYARKNPYILCILTKSDTEVGATKVIGDISNRINQYFGGGADRGVRKKMRYL